MTIIEFFDKDSIENVVSTLLCDPERVVYIGYSYKNMKKAANRYELVAYKYGRMAEFVVRGVERNDLWKIVETLEDVVTKYDDCTIDLSGGEELYLVAAGIVYQRMPDRVQLHRFNRNNDTFYDCDADGCTLSQKKLHFTVEDNIMVYGGRIIYNEEKEHGTYRWDMHPDFCYDVDVLWRLCTKHTKIWNRLLTEATEDPLDPLTVHVDMVSYAMQQVEAGPVIPELFRELADEGLISTPMMLKYDMSFRCKDEQIKRCLLKAGVVLELKTAILLDDTGLYQDVTSGVVLDWDDKVGNNDVENEIDVIGMYGIIPVFISCKNGTVVETDELYKLKAVAERFGGEHGRKVLVASYPMSEDFNRRAHELHIRVIDGVRDMSETEFLSALTNITGELNK